MVSTVLLFKAVRVLYRGLKGAKVRSLSLSSDGKLLALQAGSDVFVFEVESGRELWSRAPWRGYHNVSFVEQGGEPVLAIGVKGLPALGTALCCLFDGVSGKKIRSFDLVDTLRLHGDPVFCVGPSCQWIAAGWCVANAVWAYLWSTESDYSISDRRRLGARGRVSAWTFSPAMRLVAAGMEDGNVNVWTVAKPPPRKPILEPKVVRRCTITIGGRSSEFAVTDEDLERMEDAYGERLEGHTGRVTSLNFHPDGERLVSAGKDGTVRVWSVPAQEEISRLRVESGEARSVAFSPDGHLLAAIGQTTVHLWNSTTWTEVQRLKGHSKAVCAVAFLPGDEIVLSGGNDQAVRAWDVATAHQLWQLSAKRVGVWGKVFERQLI
jgi:WD40 repeat protein